MCRRPHLYLGIRPLDKDNCVHRAGAPGSAAPAAVTGTRLLQSYEDEGRVNTRIASCLREIAFRRSGPIRVLRVPHVRGTLQNRVPVKSVGRRNVYPFTALNLTHPTLQPDTKGLGNRFFQYPVGRLGFSARRQCHPTKVSILAKTVAFSAMIRLPYRLDIPTGRAAFIAVSIVVDYLKNIAC